MAKNKKYNSGPIIDNGIPIQDWKPTLGPDYTVIFQNSHEAMCMLDAEESICFWNKGSEILFGFSSEEMMGKNFHLLLGADVRGLSLEEGTSIVKGKRKDGSKLTLELSVGAKVSSGRLRFIVAKISISKLQYRIRFESLISSISTHFIQLSSARIDRGINYALHAIGKFAKVDQALRDAKLKYLNIFENAVEGIYQSSPSGRYLDVNPAMAKIFGYPGAKEMVDSVMDISTEHYLNPERRTEFLRNLKELGRVVEFESQVKRKDGQVIWISENARAVLTSIGDLDYCEGTVMEVTDRKLMAEKLVHGSLHDALTGLPNRTLFMERMGQAMEHSRQNPKNLCAILMLDLDRFQMVIDSKGHLYGDKMLVAFATRLQAILPIKTTLSRLGGDEFCILVEELPDSSHASILADHIQEALSLPFSLEAKDVYAAASIGIAISSGMENGAEELLRDADTAMHKAKLAGKGRYEIFDVSMHTKAVQLHTLETDLRKALERGEFRLHYQPIVSLDNSSLMGFEALIRWQHPTLGMVSPMDFIPLAEDTGLIISIGRWVLWQSCKQLVEWQSILNYGNPLTMSVNLSGKQLLDMDLVRQVSAILSQTKLAAKCLKLEVTESAIMVNPEKAAVILNSLKDLGIQLSLDDFGTGYSSLSYLHRFPFHNLKIDRSFISKMEAGDKDEEIVKVINLLAKNLGMEVVAEGIETLGQWVILNKLSCAYGQGYYFSRPLDENAATNLIMAGGFKPRGPHG